MSRAPTISPLPAARGPAEEPHDPAIGTPPPPGDPSTGVASPVDTGVLLLVGVALWFSLTLLFILARRQSGFGAGCQGDAHSPSRSIDMPRDTVSPGHQVGRGSEGPKPPHPSTAPAVSTTRPDPHLRGRAHVIDGDTIVVAGRNVRLFGIDAPELDHPWGINAKWALVRLCRKQIVTVETTGAFSHQRLVARCYLEDGRDLSAEMVRAGFALDWPKYSGGVYRHLELAGIRNKFWRASARQRGRMPS